MHPMPLLQELGQMLELPHFWMTLDHGPSLVSLSVWMADQTQQTQTKLQAQKKLLTLWWPLPQRNQQVHRLLLPLLVSERQCHCPYLIPKLQIWDCGVMSVIVLWMD